jgi:hypothetical protein
LLFGDYRENYSAAADFRKIRRAPIICSLFTAFFCGDNGGQSLATFAEIWPPAQARTRDSRTECESKQAGFWLGLLDLRQHDIAIGAKIARRIRPPSGR